MRRSAGAIRGAWIRGVCCALLVLGAVSRSAAQDAEEADADAEDVEDAEVEDEAGAGDECVERPLGWLARRGLVSYLSDVYPWITQAIIEESLVTCEDDEVTRVQVTFEPHLSGPRWERVWTFECERTGTLSWSCPFPDEQTFVYLSEGDVGVPIQPDVEPGEALEALAAIVLQSNAPGGIPDPFDASDPFLELTVDSMLSVARDEICAGLLVPVQLDPEAARNQFCVERAECEAPDDLCPWTVRVEGATE
jgi:hypothetical protein